MRLFRYAMVWVWALLWGIPMARAEEGGLAARYPLDRGIHTHKDVLFVDGFDKATSPLLNPGRKIRREATFAMAGEGCLESIHVKGKHVPFNTFGWVKPNDTVHLRFYTKFPKGYDLSKGEKGPGLGAFSPAHKQLAGGGGAGIKPKGNDKSSGRVVFDAGGEPCLYYYHMDMGQWGSHKAQNIGRPARLRPGVWHCLELMIKANTPGKKDGEIHLWVDGAHKARYEGIRWRSDPELKLNAYNHSAYVGGDWTSPANQSRYEDLYVVARAYIGPTPKRKARTQEGPAAPVLVKAWDSGVYVEKHKLQHPKLLEQLLDQDLGGPWAVP